MGSKCSRTGWVRAEARAMMVIVVVLSAILYLSIDDRFAKNTNYCN